jgi:hypothetical protein
MSRDEGGVVAAAKASEADDRIADRLTRGVCRLFADHGYGTLTEFRLPNGRRVDIIGLGVAGDFSIVEVKSSIEDYRADRKWREYLPFCERFFFAVPEGFPARFLPDGCGLIVADGFAAAIRRPSPVQRVNGVRKRRQLVRFAMAASLRLRGMADPRIDGDG